jgi:hypothetical protein
MRRAPGDELLDAAGPCAPTGAVISGLAGSIHGLASGPPPQLGPASRRLAEALAPR